MKIQVNRLMLLDALKVGGAVAGKCKTIPILDCCKVSVKGDKMVVTSTDTEITIAKKVSIISSEAERADFCVIPNDLTTILATIRQEDVILDVDDNTCELKHARGAAKVSVLPAMDFPSPVATENKCSFTMDAHKLSNWLDASKNFVAVDPLRPAITGMYLAVEDGEVWSAASDSFKMHMDGYKDETLYGINTSMIVPSKVFGYASSLLSGYSAVSVQADDNNIAFVVADAKISARLVVGSYPKVKSIVPSRTPIVVEANTQDLRDSLSRIKLFADQKTKLVELSFSPDGINLRSSDILTNKSCEDSCDVLMYDGDPIEVCTKTDSLEAILSKIDSETVAIGMTTHKSPIVIYEADNKNKILFTMPLLKPNSNGK